jgi:uncharacterized membrane protein YebE (DUF533 family)
LFCSTSTKYIAQITKRTPKNKAPAIKMAPTKASESHKNIAEATTTPIIKTIIPAAKSFDSGEN